jgi:hypothetical protein
MRDSFMFSVSHGQPPFTDFSALYNAAVTEVVVSHPPPDYSIFGDYLAWLLFVTPITCSLMLTPLYDWVVLQSWWLILGIGIATYLISGFWVKLVGLLIDSAATNASYQRISGQRASFKIDLGSLIESEKQAFEAFIERKKSTDASLHLPNDELKRGLAQRLTAEALSQAGLTAQAPVWEKTAALKRRFRQRGMNNLLWLAILILGSFASEPGRAWLLLAPLTLAWLMLPARMTVNPQEAAFYLAFNDELGRSSYCRPRFTSSL